MDPVIDPVTDPVVRLLGELLEDPPSTGDLRKRLEITHRPTFRRNYLHQALKEQFIEMTIPEKPSSPLQKYRLTEKGR